jgi:O-antigen/teichoic acid export membrane protein
VQLEKRILGNATSLGVSAILGQLANFGFVVLVARGFGRDVFAQYVFSMATGALICVLVTFGSISLLIRASAQSRSGGLDMLTAILPFNVFVGLLVWAGTILSGFVYSMTTEQLAILACIVAHHVIIRITAVLQSQLQGQERMDLVARTQVGRSVLALALGVVLALTTRNAVAGVSAMPIASIVFLFYAGAMLKSVLGPIKWQWDPKSAWHVVRQALPFLLIVALATGNERLGILMLYALQDGNSVATFATGERIISAAAVFYVMLTAATLPSAARLAQTDAEQYRILINKIARLINLAVLPIATLLFLFSDDVIAMLFGDNFSTSAPILRVIAFVFVVRALSAIQEMAAVSSEQQRVVVFGRIAGLIFLLILGPPLIHLEGSKGLAYAMVGAELGYAAVTHVLLRRVGVRISPLRVSLRTAVACGVTIAIGGLSNDLGLLLRSLIVGGCLVAGLWGFGAVSVQDIKYLLAIMKTKRLKSTGAA